MKRQRRNRSPLGISLFPFLAVLICTVGVLIVLLVLMVHMARVDAAEEADGPQPLAPADSRQLAKEEYEWQQTLLAQQRDRARQEAAGRRLELSHLEEHIRELEQRWQALRDSAADLELRLRGQGTGQQADQTQLTELRAAIQAAQDELRAAQQQAASQSPVYAIVPYEGPQGTRRRPIYIECTARGVIIQPHGIVLQARDFAGPMGPGNPLDAALRGIREYHARLGTLGAQDEPYPLLIVRPDGVEAYAAARTAMRSWDDEFGYELVDAAMQLAYPEADPALTQLIEKVVKDAQSRQAILAAAMPSHFGGAADIGFVASPTSGGFRRQHEGDQELMGSRGGGFGRGGDGRYADGTAQGAPAESPGDVTPGFHPSTSRQGPGTAAPDIQSVRGGSPMTKARGRDWGLPTQAAQATGIVRPIRVACLADRLILFPERDDRRSPETILVQGAMLDEVETLADKILARVESWGIAVAGGYWKPVLNVHVAPGADTRFDELSALLDGSGWDVRRSDP